MSRGQLAHAPWLNLSGAYLELAHHVESSAIHREERFTCCLGEVQHPICNFAMELKLDEEAAATLASIASQRKCFNVYSDPSEWSAMNSQLLRKAGFRQTHNLSMMVSDVASADPAQLIRTTAATDRTEIAEFMVAQFFPGHSRATLQALSRALVASPAMDLYGLFCDQLLVGSVMLFRHAGVLGLYNLCVAQPHQGRGFGSSIVSACQALAAQMDLALTLQCNRRLEKWYQSLGCRLVGVIDVYTLGNE